MPINRNETQQHMPMYEKIVYSFFSPSRLFKYLKSHESYKAAFVYQAVAAFVFLLLNFVVFFVMGSSLLTKAYEIFGWLTNLGIVAIFAVLWAGLVVFNFLSSVVYHAFVKLLGGKGGFLATYKVVSHGFTPSGLLGWIPVIGLIFTFESFYLNIRGFVALHDMPVHRAFWSLVLPVIIVLILLIVLAVKFVLSFIPFT